MANWKRKQQEQDDQDYWFAGQCFMTAGVSSEIPMSEIILILVDLKQFVQEKQGIDYLQVYESDDGKVLWIIDQLNREMIASGDHPPEHNHHTVLFPHEY